MPEISERQEKRVIIRYLCEQYQELPMSAVFPEIGYHGIIWYQLYHNSTVILIEVLTGGKTELSEQI